MLGSVHALDLGHGLDHNRVMSRLALRYLGHREGVPLTYFTGAGVDLEPGAVTEVSTNEGIVLGRRASAGLRVASSIVAPAHARVRRVGDEILVEDLRSTNGTRVNDARVDSATLAVGDRLTLADAFDFELVELD